MVSVCGANCEGCSYSAECVGGCEKLQGRVFWTKYIGAVICPVYRCVKDKGHRTCGDCAKIPCETWVAIKDPNLSDEEHEKSIAARVEKLKAARGN